jgi:asparagine synthase (glutamine-hydrolysing)
LLGSNQINYHFTTDGWVKSCLAHAKGAAFIKNRFLQACDLAEMVASTKDFDGLVSFVRELNGFFAAVAIRDDSAFLTVDHVRSFPLFYAVQGKEVFVSDDANWIRTRVGDEKIDDSSITEFLLTRAVSGRDTLLSSVKQVQAGEAVALLLTSGGIKIESDRFYTFDYAQPTTHSFSELIVAADAALTPTFSRLTKFAGGRTIVVPLGGGLDSRLIVLFLKLSGYDKVITFTYGRPGYKESKISRRVASELGFTWIFIPYSNESWRRWGRSKEWTEYLRFAHGLCTTPHIQDFPAVWELKREGLVPDDSVLVPGHMPTPNDASHRLPVEWIKEETISADELVTKITESYCTLQDWSRLRTLIQPELCKKINDVLQPPSALTPEEAISYFDRWWWESSWAKFIVNSVRVYDFWGYSWWLPLWDYELVKFWRTLPFDLRFEDRFEHAYVRQLETKTTGRPPISDNSNHNYGPTIVKLLDKVHLRNRARRIRARREYGHHHFAWYGLIPETEYKRAFHGQENINTFLANQTVKDIFPNHTIPPGLDILGSTCERKLRT